MKEGYVQSNTTRGITTIEFHHPKSNSLPGILLKELVDAITKASASEDSRVIILKSAGEKAFCAGASFSELLAIENEEQGLAFFSGFAHVINAMRKCRKLILGRIQGSCVGGGVGIAAAVDYAFATQEARVKLSELAVGIGPFVVGPAIERKTGIAAFSQLAINAGSWQTAGWAHQKGLFAQVFDTTEEMDAAIDSLALTLAASNLDAIQELKSVFWSGTDDWDKLLLQRAKISGTLVLSNFTREAIEKFRKG